MSLALIGLAVAGTTTVAAAQGVGSGQAPQAGRAGVRGGVGVASSDSVRGGHGGPRGARAALNGLNLTQQQKTQIHAINKKYADQFKQLRQANGTNGAAQNANNRVQMQAIAERERAEIRGVLTPAQRTQFDANVAKQRTKGKSGARRK